MITSMRMGPGAVALVACLFSALAPAAELEAPAAELEAPAAELEAPAADDQWTRKGGTLSVDANGWTNKPSLATDADGALYLAWLQHLNPASWELSGVRVKRWHDGAWADLGGRIGHTRGGDVRWPSAYDPSIAVVDGVPYVGWYEGGGYGWSKRRAAQVFVSRWADGEWVPASRSNDPEFGALNHAGGGRNISLANIDGVLYAAWVEHLREERRADQVVVKRLGASGWELVAQPFSHAEGRRKIIDVAIVGVSGVPHVAWTELSRFWRKGIAHIRPTRVHLARLSGRGAFEPVGNPISAATGGYVNYLALAAHGPVLHLAWQEKSPAGPYQVHAGQLANGRWRASPESLNVAPGEGEAGPPTLAAGKDAVWLAWAESPPGKKAQLVARSFDGNAWSAPSGSLNQSPGDGSAGSPSLAVLGGVPQVAWVERHFPSSTKQVYVSGRDASGDDAPVALAPYGADGPAVDLQPNTWTVVNAGGIVAGAQGVVDEGYSSINYVSAIKRAVVFGKYHAVGTSSGEDQNALLGYSFERNRWDLIEITENAWSEHLPGIGHDEGNVAVDSQRGLYFSSGNLTLNGGTRYHSYVYDLLAGRGKRLLPPRGNEGIKEATGALDPVRRRIFMRGRLYDFATNTFEPVTGCTDLGWAAMAFDNVNRVFVQFGGRAYKRPGSSKTRVLKAAGSRCELREPAESPPAGISHMTFNDRHGTIMMLSGKPLELWRYDVLDNRWTKLPDPPADMRNSHGQKLTYDSDADVLLFHDGVNLGKLRAFRYVP